MNALLKQYPSYKSSGVPWLGETPDHWKVRRLKGRVANVIDQRSDRGFNEIYIALEHVESWTGRIRIVSESHIDSQVKRFRKDDVLFGKLRPYLAKVTRPGCYGVCVGEFLVFRPRSNDLDSAYLESVLRSKPFIEAVNASTFGAKMPRAEWSFIGNMNLPVPPAREQIAIVRYLNHLEQRIRRCIEAKEKLITLLEEQKQTIIHQAVKGQIDVRTGKPYPAYKPSEVEWLEEIPEHWTIEPMKRVVRQRVGAIKAGPFGSDLKSIEMTDTEYKVYTQRNVIEQDLSSGRNYISRSKFEELRAFEVFPGDVLVTSRGTIGRTVLVTNDCEPGILHPCLLRIRPDPEYIMAEYLMLLIQYSQYLSRQLKLQSNATTIEVIYTSTLANLTIPIPPLDEQIVILDAVKDSTLKLETEISRASRLQLLLSEYRTRLIADVVTGKLDVRKVAAELPYEADAF